MINFKIMSILFFFFIGIQAFAQLNHQPLNEVRYLLAIDRLDFYVKRLALHLNGKVDQQITQDLMGLQVQDYVFKNINSQNFSLMEQTDQWDNLIARALVNKHPDRKYSIESLEKNLEWKYQFLKNKLLERFKVKDVKITNNFVWGQVTGDMPETQFSIPQIDDTKILLDVENYVAEKTSRAIIWDAIKNKRTFSFHIGSEKEFQEFMQFRQLEIVAEILPMARNYNKIFLVKNPQTQEFSYMINLISGEDRVIHLVTQLSLIHFKDNKYPFKNVKVIGNSEEYHQKIENNLVNMMKNLPQVDQVIIGQKGAFEEYIKTSGMLDITLSRLSDLTPADPKKQKQFEKWKQEIQSKGAFSNGQQNIPFDLENEFQKSNDFDRNFTQFNSEQLSHDFSDYLLIDKSGNIQRWRIFSAVWGDEIIPIARALRKSNNHSNVIYIGTAGGLRDKGLKVGDVVGGHHVITHQGSKLAFSKPELTADQREYVIGQVKTPFFETQKWFQNVQPKIDIVEVETGYLRENLGPASQLQAYFLISDIVGSDHETLAQAATNSSKRKKNQQRLISAIFDKNQIISPVSNWTLLHNAKDFQKIYQELKNLRNTRDLESLVQLSYLALANGISTEQGLEDLIKKTTAFSRVEFSQALSLLETLAIEIQKKGFYINNLSEILSGSWNPKNKTLLQVVGPANSNEHEPLKFIKQFGFDIELQNLIDKYFKFEIEYEKPNSRPVDFISKGNLIELYRKEILNPIGFDFELDAKGQYKVKEVPYLGSQIRCEFIFN